MKRVASKRPALFTRKFKKARGIVTVPRTIITPKRLNYLWATLTYSDWQYALNPGVAGTAGVQVLAANGLYDIDVSGIGHQPVGFDQLMAMFNEYCVVKAEIEATFINTDTTYPQNIGISFQDNSTVTTDGRVYIENGNCVSKVIGNATGATPNIGVLRMSIPIQKYSKKQNILNEDNFSGRITSNPTDTHFFHCFAAPVDSGQDAATVHLRVVITYSVLFREPSGLNALS